MWCCWPTPRAGGYRFEQLSRAAWRAQNSRQGYYRARGRTVRSTFPTLGRVRIAGSDHRGTPRLLVPASASRTRIDPTFQARDFRIQFAADHVSIGGAVGRSQRFVPVTLTPLYLEEALAAAGGITSKIQDYCLEFRLLPRWPRLYQIPLFAALFQAPA